MQACKQTFEFHDRQVLVEVEPVGTSWRWKYAIDGGPAVTGMSDYSFSEHAALEEAGMAARDRIRTQRNPMWRSTSGFGYLAAAIT